MPYDVVIAWVLCRGVRSSSSPRCGIGIDLSTRRPNDEPHTKQLDGKLRELRFYLGSQPVRITYWIASGRRIVLLTVFTKTRRQERRQIDRARKAMERCMAEQHTTEDDDD